MNGYQMTGDGPTVLVSGTERDRVSEIASTLDSRFAIRTNVTTDAEGWPTVDEDVVILVGGANWDNSLGSQPDDAACVVVYEDADNLDGDHSADCDHVLVEPLLADNLESTVASLARRVRYDRRLQECAELATRCGQTESIRDDGTTDEPQKLRKRVEDITAELDGLLAEFSNDDFRQAFRTIAAD